MNAFLRSGTTVALLALLLTGAARAPVSASEQLGPRAVLDALYKDQLKPKPSDWTSRADRPRWLSASLVKLWSRADRHRPKDDELGPVDFDLASDTNGLTLRGAETKVETQEATHAVVAVKLRYGEQNAPPGLLHYEFVQENGAWKIDELRSQSWSLRKILALYLRTP